LSDPKTGAILTLDRGNSTLDCMVWGETARRTRLEPGDEAGLRRFLGGRCPPRAVGLTVVEGGLAPAQAVLEELGTQLRLAGADLEVPLRVIYQDPETLGIDRLVGALAAHLRYGRGVVVDLGTAVTVNLVRDGVFLGGAIAPGPTAMAQGLAASAPALPKVDLAAEVRLPAESSADAVNAGVLVGFCGLVEGLVTAVASAGGLGDAPHLLTGGQAGLYLETSGPGRGLHWEYVPDLVHQGLRWLATEI
jgi:pantothenate kinase type III